jgi:hypothetical protein
MRVMPVRSTVTRRFRCAWAIFAVVLFSGVALGAQVSPAGAASVLPFDYQVIASTHIKKLNQDITVPPGEFVGNVDLDAQTLVGNMVLPAATFEFPMAGVGLVTATAKMAQLKQVTGTIDFSQFPSITVVATATISVRLIDVHLIGTTKNLVGPFCRTSRPVVVTMAGQASFTDASTFSGVYTIPPFRDCGNATTAINLVIPGPGNTFTATAIPM